MGNSPETENVSREERRTTRGLAFCLCSLLSFGILGCINGLDFSFFPKFVYGLYFQIYLLEYLFYLWFTNVIDIEIFILYQQIKNDQSKLDTTHKT